MMFWRQHCHAYSCGLSIDFMWFSYWCPWFVLLWVLWVYNFIFKLVAPFNSVNIGQLKLLFAESALQGCFVLFLAEHI